MKTEIPYIGRKSELQALKQISTRKISSLVVVKGRRRIGKSRLIQEFGKTQKLYTLSGLPPSSNSTAQNQRDEFMRQLASQLDIPNFQLQDWGDVFQILAKQVENQKCIILLDEISWMGSNDPNFLGKLKIAWDLYFSNNPSLTLILCGSISSWIEKNILSSTGFFGRVDLILTLQELSLQESFTLLKALGFKGSKYEALKYLCISGGIPRYLEIINPKTPIMQNIKTLCFKPEGLFVGEYNKIFHDLFAGRSAIFKKIVNSLVDGPKSQKSIADVINYSNSGPLSEYIQDLVTSGFIRTISSWSFTKQTNKNYSRFALKDNYLRFYLKFIEPKLSKIKQNAFQEFDITTTKGFDSFMGFQLENLICNNRQNLIEHLRLTEAQIINDGPYYQSKTTTQEGCQIDYLIHTRFNTLYVIEIKFCSGEIKKSVIKDIQTKIDKLNLPNKIVAIPVLLYVGELPNSLSQSEFFGATIDIEELF